jgi:hypothetical protein
MPMGLDSRFRGNDFAVRQYSQRMEFAFTGKALRGRNETGGSADWSRSRQRRQGCLLRNFSAFTEVVTMAA